MMFLRSILLGFWLFLLFNERMCSGNDWWSKMLLYQVYPRSFMDSDGDGIGDLNGITLKLDHIIDTGAAAVWISPIFKSPMYDFGYDISDYTDIAEEYGTFEDFDKLVRTAKEKGLKLIMDFVPNHTSHLHEWFEKSVKKVPGFEDFYVWHPGKPDPENPDRKVAPSNWMSVFRNSAWTWNEERKEYYYHQFMPEQPDLNFRNPNVLAAVKDVMRFWLNRGVYGFRIDSIVHLFEVDCKEECPDEPVSGSTDDEGAYGYLQHLYTRDLDELYDVVYDWRLFLNEYEGDDRIMMMEAMSESHFVMKYYGNSIMDGAHFPFNFNLVFLKSHDVGKLKSAVDSWLQDIPEGRTSNWVVGNHDQPRLASRFGEPLSEGIIMVQLLLPGVAVTYQGEEIGMIDQFLSFEDTRDPQALKRGPIDYFKDSRDPQRTPFQWDKTKNAGFSKAPKPWLPIGDTYKEINLGSQKDQENSHYHIYKSISELRNHPTIKHGSVKTATFKDKVFAYSRTLNNEETFIILINTSPTATKINLKSKFKNIDRFLNILITSRNSNRIKGTQLSSSSLTLTGQESLVLSCSSGNIDREFVNIA